MRQEPEGFAEYWAIWKPFARHTDGRGDARRTFEKHVRNGADPQDIIDGAKAFFRTMKDEDRKYVPLASTWLNRESFEDFAEQERAHQARLLESGRRREIDRTNVVDMKPASAEIDPEVRARMVAEAKARMRGQA